MTTTTVPLSLLPALGPHHLSLTAAAARHLVVRDDPALHPSM
ncbi:hypothetical protein [Streptomyces kronopolitis]